MTAPVVTTVPVVREYRPGSIEQYICSLPWDCATALCIARRESGTDRDGNLDGWWATNGEGQWAVYGLFQLRAYYHAPKFPDFWEKWMDPYRNADYAYAIYQESGWSPWDGSPGCWP